MISRRQIISGSAGPIFAIFSPNESVLGADDRSGPLFRYLKGRCHGNRFCEKWQTLHFRHSGIQKWNWISLPHVCTNSANDTCISFENFVKFGPVIPELTGLICERLVRHGQKTVVFSRISLNILDRFSQSFHYMKALYVQMMDLYLISQFVKGMLPWQPNNAAVMKANWYYVHSLHVRQIWARFCFATTCDAERAVRLALPCISRAKAAYSHRTFSPRLQPSVAVCVCACTVQCIMAK